MNKKLLFGVLIISLFIPSFTFALVVEEPLTNDTIGNSTILEYFDETIIITTYDNWTFIKSQPKADNETVIQSYQQKSIDRLDYIANSSEWPMPVPAMITFSKPLTEDEVVWMAENSGFEIISLEYISTPIGGGEIPYPIDYEKLANMEQEIKEFERQSKNITDFVLIEGYVSARILLNTTPLNISSNKNQFSIDVGSVEFLQIYPDAIIVPGRSFFYTYNKIIASNDRKPPEINYVNVSPPVTNFSNIITVTANVTDNVVVDKVNITIAGITFVLTDTDGDGIFTNDAVTTPTIEGTYTTVNITAFDLAGNSAYNDSAVVIVNNTPPIISILSPPNVTITDTSPYLNMTVSEPSNIIYSWNNEGNITGCQNCTTYNTTYGEATSDTNTSLLLHFNENSGNTTYDDSPNDNDGTILGPAWTLYGRFGPALNFDGVDDFVSVPYDSSLNIANTLTFGAWIYPDYDSPPNGPGPFFITKNKGYAIGIPNGEIKTFLYINGKWVGHRSNTSVPMRLWSYVFATYNGTTVKMYLNGTQIYSGQETGDINTANTKELKVGWCGGHKRFKGIIDEVQVFDRVLNASEVVEYYNASLIPGPHSVTVYAKDESNNQNLTTRWFSVAYS